MKIGGKRKEGRVRKERQERENKIGMGSEGELKGKDVNWA